MISASPTRVLTIFSGYNSSSSGSSDCSSTVGSAGSVGSAGFVSAGCIISVPSAGTSSTVGSGSDTGTGSSAPDAVCSVTGVSAGTSSVAVTGISWPRTMLKARNRLKHRVICFFLIKFPLLFFPILVFSGQDPFRNNGSCPRQVFIGAGTVPAPLPPRLHFPLGRKTAGRVFLLHAFPLSK